MFTDESHFMKVVKFLVEFLLNVVIIESEKRHSLYVIGSKTNQSCRSGCQQLRASQIEDTEILCSKKRVKKKISVRSFSHCIAPFFNNY